MSGISESVAEWRPGSVLSDLDFILVRTDAFLQEKILNNIKAVKYLLD